MTDRNSSLRTETLGLSQFEPDDFITIQGDYNADMSDIDTWANEVNEKLESGITTETDPVFEAARPALALKTEVEAAEESAKIHTDTKLTDYLTEAETNELIHELLKSLLVDKGPVPNRAGLPLTSSNYDSYMIENEEIIVFAYNVSPTQLEWLPLNFFADMSLYETVSGATEKMNSAIGTAAAALQGHEAKDGVHVTTQDREKWGKIPNAGEVSFDHLIREWLSATTVQGAIDQLSQDVGAFTRRTSSLTLDFTTDELNGNQTLTQIISRRLQDSTLWVNNDTFYALTININPGTSTTATLRINGLKLRNSYLDININNGVTLAAVRIEWNDVGRLLINNNAERINGNVIIDSNRTQYGQVEFNWNSATTVSPAAPRQRLHSVITGGLSMLNNIAQRGDVIYRQGGLTELGVVDAHGRVNSGTAPAAGTTAPGVININRNRAYSVFGIIYSNYTELPVGEFDYSDYPGAFVASTSYVYYNDCLYDCYFTVQSGWIPGTEPTVQHVYTGYNRTGRNCYLNCGENAAASTFATHFTATALADNNGTSRNTVQLSAALTAGQAACIVGMNAMFENAHTSASNAGNFTGTTKQVTAYDPDTQTITLSSAFTQPRPYNATIRFFYNTGNTRLWYGTNNKIARMIAYAKDKELPCGILVADGTVFSNNLSNGRKIAEVDTVNNVITLSSGLAGIAWRNANAWVCTLTAPKTFGDLATSLTSTGGTYRKIAPGQIESNGDLRATNYPRDVVGCRITSPAITTSTSREIIAAEFSDTPGQENRLRLTFDSDDSFPVNSSTLVEYTIRRIPGFGIMSVLNNRRPPETCFK